MKLPDNRTAIQNTRQEVAEVGTDHHQTNQQGNYREASFFPRIRHPMLRQSASQLANCLTSDYPANNQQATSE